MTTDEPKRGSIAAVAKAIRPKIVGERGPERFKLPRGSRLYDGQNEEWNQVDVEQLAYRISQIQNRRSEKTDMNITLEAERLPGTITVNGVEYRRQSDWIDEKIALILDYQKIARATGISFREAVFLASPNMVTLPD